MESQTVVDTAGTRTALLSITTPVSGIKIPDHVEGAIIVVVSTRLGTVMTDIGSGATVRGSGSHSLSISGTATQVAAKLATLTYASTAPGLDQLSVILLTPGAAALPVLQAPLAVLPLAGTPPAASGLVYFDSGTLTLESRLLDGPDLAVKEPVGGLNAATIILDNSTIGAANRLTIRNDNVAGGVMPRLAIAGRVELAGSTSLAGAGTAVSLALGATLINSGSMAVDGHGTRFTGGGTLVNNGLIRILGDGVTGAPVQIATSLTGAGTVSLDTGASLQLDGSVGAGETIRFDAGTSTLHLSHAKTFAGSITGLSLGNTIVFDKTAISDALYTRAVEAGGGVLTLLDGTLAVTKIHVDALETGTAFHLGNDADGNAVISLTTVNPGAVDVFRFFDAAHGTQLLTQDAVERDTILATRSDLQYEGVGLHAVDPAHTSPASVDVYRFFDTNNGTHFMTSSVSERNTVLASRPDLVFERSSTMVEHATAQRGDSAVYRFFNGTNGSHFYTADAGERASIMSTRPDMSFEGIAFYAPAA